MAAAQSRFMCSLFRRSGLQLRNYYGSGSGVIWLDDLHCAGNEMSLTECSHLGLSVHNCGHYEDVSIVCGNGACLFLLYLTFIRS